MPATLQFLGHEEGRIRYNSSSKVFNWDYFLRDHLGNVRMVLTEEQKTTAYPAATMEDALASTEQALYANLTETRSSLPGGYPVDNSYSDPNLKAARVNGNGQKIGPSITLKVMAGDKFHVRVSSWYRTVSGVPSTTSSPLTQLINALSAGMAPLSGGKVSSPELSSSSLFAGEVTKFLESQDNYTTTRPKAFLNWILFDEQFNMVASSSGFEQVPEESVYSNTTTPKVYNHVKTNLPVHKNGYLYIYVSNETQGLDLFFDNLQVTHIAGPVVEETHYYPFGLTMAGISSKALGKLENKYKFNEGTELANKEFNDGSGLEWYGTHFRQLDPQLGRWNQIDPEPKNEESPYAAMANNPLRYNDPLGNDTLPSGKYIWDQGAVEELEAMAAENPDATWSPNLAERLYMLGEVLLVTVLPEIAPVKGSRIPKGVGSESKASAPKPGEINRVKGEYSKLKDGKSGAGRGKNNRKPDPKATGDHSVIDKNGNTTYKQNSLNPSGFDEVKKTDIKGKAHTNTDGTKVETPHVHEKGKKNVRSAKKGEDY